MSFAPTPFYDILPNDYLNMTLMGQVVDNKSGMGMASGGSQAYPFPASAEGLPIYPTYNEVPFFQTTPPSFPSTSSAASPASWEDVLSQSSSSSLLQTPPPLPSTSNVESPLSWDPSWGQLPTDPGPFRFPPTAPLPYPIQASCSAPSSSQSSATLPLDLSQFYPESDSMAVEGEESHKFTGAERRERDHASQHAGLPYKRTPKTKIGYGAMMASLPGELQKKVKLEYECCVGINKKDKSTKMKHWFSNKHFRKAVGKEFFYLQPISVCPAFIAMMGGCKNAKGSRCDSSDRHCLDCQAFKEFYDGCSNEGMEVSPIMLTRGEHEAIRDFRKQALPGQRCYSPQVQNAVFELLKMMVTSKVSAKGKGKAED